jgi:photosystem I reaction center subunit XII
MDLRSSHGEVFVMSISDSQVFIALFAALLAGILAIRLGIELYT